LATNEWHKKIEFPDGDTVIMHSPQVIVHYPPSAAPDQYGTTQATIFATFLPYAFCVFLAAGYVQTQSCSQGN
jgi:hypothetical protein